MMISQESLPRVARGEDNEPIACTEQDVTASGAPLIELITRLVLRKWLILKVTAFAASAGVLLGLLLPVQYTSIAKIMSPQQTQSTASLVMNQLASNGAAPLAAITGGSLGLKNPNDLYIGLMDSRPVADAIVQRFKLAEVYRSRDMTMARQRLAENTIIASEKSGLISISVMDRDKDRAAELANAYADELRALTKTLAVTEASRRRLFYEGQLKEAKEALVTAELNFQQVQQNKGMVQLDAQAKAMIDSLAASRAKVAAKQVEVQALRSYSTDRNPELQLAQSELSSLQAEVAGLEQSSHSSGFTDLGMKDVPSAGLDYLSAQHEVLYRQTLFDLLIKQYDSARLDEAKDAVVIQVVEPAIPPDRKSSPHRAQITLLFTLIGWMGACIYVMIGEIIRRDPGLSQSLDRLKVALIGRSTHPERVRNRSVSA